MRDHFEDLFAPDRLWNDVIASERGRRDLAARQSSGVEPLEALLRHCFTQVPAYRDARGTSATFTDLPLLTRREVADGGSRFHAVGARQSYSATTSGTSGVPLCIVRDDAAVYSFVHRTNASLIPEDVDPRYLARCANGPVIVIVNDNPLQQEIGALNPELAYARTLRLVISRSSLEDDRRARYLASISPAVLTGRPRALKALGERMRALNLTLRPLSVVCSGDELDDESRETIEAVFQAAVRNAYACQEAGLVALECRFREGLHVRPNLIVEVRDDEGRISCEGSGLLILTPLDNHAMPLLRYVIGDWGRLVRKECRCGHSGQTLVALDGRVSPYFRIGGVRMNPSVLLNPFERAKVRRFQVIQQAGGGFVVRIWGIPDRGEARTRLVSDISQLLLPESVRFHDEEIEPPLGEKFQRFVVESGFPDDARRR